MVLRNMHICAIFRSQELELQNRTKTNKLGKVVVIFNGENHSEN